MNKILICGCGCLGITRSDVVVTKVNGHNAWRCPNHSKFKHGAVQSVIVTCADCGIKEIVTFKQSIRKSRCDPCQDKHRRKLITARNQARESTSSSGPHNSVWYK